MREWHFNVERRVPRYLEIDRWASPARQYRVTQTSRAGLLTELPEFSLGAGLTVRPAVTTGGGIPAPSAEAWWYVIPPGLCITTLVLAVAMLGYLFEEYVNPRLLEEPA